VSFDRPRVKREATRFMKFIVVGTIGAVVDFGTFNILNGLLGVWSVAASVMSFTAAVSSNFLWNRFWTYPDSRSKRLHHQVGQFITVSLIGLAIRTPLFAFVEAPAIRFAERYNLVALGTRYLPLPGGLDTTMLGRNMALALAVVIVMTWNFGINRLWTYGDVS
jgi:putative flippase GtrA